MSHVAVTARVSPGGTVWSVSYSTDLTDEQWALLEPVFNAPGKRAPRSPMVASDAPAGWPSRTRTPPPPRPAGSTTPASQRCCAICHGNERAAAPLRSQPDHTREPRGTTQVHATVETAKSAPEPGWTRPDFVGERTSSAYAL